MGHRDNREGKEVGTGRVSRALHIVYRGAIRLIDPQERRSQAGGPGILLPQSKKQFRNTRYIRISEAVK